MYDENCRELFIMSFQQNLHMQQFRVPLIPVTPLAARAANATGSGHSPQASLSNAFPAGASPYSIPTIDGMVFGILLVLLSLTLHFSILRCSGMSDTRIMTI